MSRVVVHAGIAKYWMPDDSTIEDTARGLKVSRPDRPVFYVSDLSLATVMVYDGVNDVPGDIAGGNYLYDGENWSANPDYVAPEEPE